MSRTPKCSCKRVAPRCEYCRKVSRDNARKGYTTERRRKKAARERRNKYFAKRYQLIKTGQLTPKKTDLGDWLDIAKANTILAKKPPSSAVTWLELSAGRSNS